MSKRDIRLFASDMLESIEKIQKWTRGISYEKFSEDVLIQDAVVRNLEVIGEAAKKKKFSKIEKGDRSFLVWSNKDLSPFSKTAKKRKV